METLFKNVFYFLNVEYFRAAYLNLTWVANCTCVILARSTQPRSQMILHRTLINPSGHWHNIKSHDTNLPIKNNWMFHDSFFDIFSNKIIPKTIKCTTDGLTLFSKQSSVGRYRRWGSVKYFGTKLFSKIVHQSWFSYLKVENEKNFSCLRSKVSVVMATNSDVTMTSSVVKNSDFSELFMVYFWLFCKHLERGIETDPHGKVWLFYLSQI